MIATPSRDTRYEITDCGMEDGARVIHVLDTSKVGPTRAPKCASRYYKVIPARWGYWMRREGGDESRRVAATECSCPRGDNRERLCIHKWIADALAQQARRS